MLHYAVEAAFDDLLCCWRSHHATISRNSSTLRAKADARAALDHARTRMHRLRIAIYPTSDEASGIVDSVWCETLELVVHLRWDDRDRMRPGNFRCACGHLVPIDWDALDRKRLSQEDA